MNIETEVTYIVSSLPTEALRVALQEKLNTGWRLLLVRPGGDILLTRKTTERPKSKPSK